LPRVNGAVDAYNVVSVQHAVPAGAFDLDAVIGDVVIRLAREGDAFVPLGEPDVLEQPSVGEVIYADDISVLTRHWNHRDADRTRVTPASRNVVFILESAEGDPGRAVVGQAAETLTGLLMPRSTAVTTHVLTADGDTDVTLGAIA
jgi:DNA/RNA-binding domain of Phe-tRNA-synthetase-like protein